MTKFYKVCAAIILGGTLILSSNTSKAQEVDVSAIHKPAAVGMSLLNTSPWHFLTPHQETAVLNSGTMRAAGEFCSHMVHSARNPLKLSEEHYKSLQGMCATGHFHKVRTIISGNSDYRISDKVIEQASGAHKALTASELKWVVHAVPVWNVPGANGGGIQKKEGQLK